LTAVDVLRTLWGEGVRGPTRADGSLALAPSERATPDILQLARDAKAEIAARLATLPAPGRCPICGGSTGWGEIDGSTTAHCVGCALIAAERLGLGPRYISPEIEVDPSPIPPELTRQESTG